MAKRYLQGVDVDTDGFADAMRQLADGIEDGEIMIRSSSTYSEVTSDDVATFGIEVEYNASPKYREVVNAIRFATKHYLPFTDDDDIADVLFGDKRTAVLVDLGREIPPGDTVAMVDADDGVFAEATVSAYLDMPIRRICEFGIGPYDEGDVDELVARLRNREDAPSSIDDGTFATVVLFTDVQPEDEYPTHIYDPEDDRDNTDK